MFIRGAGSIGGALVQIGGTLAGAAAPVLLPVMLLFAGLLIVFSILGGQPSTEALTATEATVANFFLDKGLDEVRTAAIMGNMQAESGMDPAKVESNGVGIGICQWSYGRADKLRAYAESKGKDWTDLTVQLEFFWEGDLFHLNWSSSYKVSGGYENPSPEPGTWVRGSKTGFMEASTVKEATEQFCYGWERPGFPRINNRIEAAEGYYSKLVNGAGGGQEYAAAEQWQKDIADACSKVPWPGASLCATWTSRVYAAAGYDSGGNGNSVLGHQGYGASYYPSRATTNLSEIKVGMLVSAQYGYDRDPSSNSDPGDLYGHVAIYIGDGMVMDSVTKGIRTTTLEDWVSQYNRGWIVCGYPWDWR